MAYQPGDYPLPQYAAYIWVEGSDLCLGTPPQAEHERGHTVRIPLAKCGVECSEWGTPKASQLGWKVLLDLLTARRRAESRDRFTIATPADPTQYIIEQALKGGGVKVKRFDEAGNRPYDMSELFTDGDEP